MQIVIQRFRKISTILRELNQACLKMQTVNDLLTMYVGAASQQALRATFVPKEEAARFDTEIVAYWSQLAGRDVTSPLFHLPLRTSGLGVGSAVQRHAAAPWIAWQSIIPTLMDASLTRHGLPVRFHTHSTRSVTPPPRSTTQQRGIRSGLQMLPSFTRAPTHANPPGCEPFSQHLAHVPKHQRGQTHMRLPIDAHQLHCIDLQMRSGVD